MSDPKQAARDFMKSHPMGVISTSSSDGEPWGAAVYYYTDEDFNIYFVTRAETKKYANIQENMKAALTVADGPAQTTVQAAGNLSVVPAEDYMSIMFEKLDGIRPETDGNWAPPLQKIHAGNFIPLKLTPNSMQYANYAQQKDDPRANYIETII